ncbi:anthranilate phosphoribosyltransferase [Sphingomonas sp. CGMCC 1.13654]|uniref:Anthranilate phosphoribosyltransferase n=1 Tax=Sphingomonas chungangi TaxID=2683589 RepID=A0A838LBJ0_9SPHN|nr:anthranilate phosphoribosyltransferase [Sphingomonas chungangi]MBA2936397.1 anthranilate phosphoribosyltransferase [Sphingomonas chungangi]MVW55782.1 anthranilate phosphoribosyltransferase [Sphingomonas chungangi]
MTEVALLPDPATPLEFETAEAAFADILDGRVPEEAIIRFITDLTLREETATEIAAAARALRERMIEVKAPAGAIDVCGTGGDGAHSLNISTAVAIVVAAAGVPVAKHGNRAASSKAGAADTLEALGLNLDRAAATAEESLEELGLAFLFAQTHHPALGKLAPVRKAIGRRTIFNIVGPLCNPGRVTRQLMGVARTDYLGTVARALDLLGTESAMIVAGDEGLDELSIAGGSRIIRLGAIGDREEHVVPGDVGVEPHPLTAIRGGDSAYNAAALARLLQGEAGPYRDAVLLNASAALIVAGRTTDWQEGADIAGEAIDDGSAERLLQRWIAF